MLLLKRNNFKGLLFLMFLLFGVKTFAAEVDTAVTYSASMKKEIKAVVVKPNDYNNNKRFPVVYLLHGFSGNYKDWTKNVPAVKELADQYHLIIVCPDGNYSSWYLDSPEMTAVKYETYISSELVSWIDEHYKTIANKKARGITGLSMGGHGALYLAFKHQDVFGVAGSMSGGLDLRPFPNNWDISNLIGTYAAHPERWEQNSVINLTHLLTPNSLKIVIQCGTEDFFYNVNVALHDKLLFNNIPHTFITGPGGHTWAFWSDAVKFQMLFMSSNFEN